MRILIVLIDTSITGYYFIDEIIARLISEYLGIKPIPLMKLRLLRGFNSK